MSLKTFKLMALKANLNNIGKRLLSDGKSFSYVLEVLLHLPGKNVKCSHKGQIARLKIILIFNCQNYQMGSKGLMSSLRTH